MKANIPPENASAAHKDFETAQEAAHRRYNHNVKLRARLLQRVERMAAKIDEAIVGPSGAGPEDDEVSPLVERYLDEMRLLFDFMARLIQDMHGLEQERNVLSFGMEAETLGLDFDGRLRVVVPAQRVEHLEDLANDEEKEG